MPLLRLYATRSLLAAALALAASELAAQERLGRLFDRAHPATVQVLVAAPDEIRQGSGFVATPDGLVVTHASLLRGASTVFARPSAGGSYHRAHVVATDEERGLAALRIEAADLPALSIGDIAVLRPGARVAAVGPAPEVGDPLARAIVRGRDPAGEAYVLDAVTELPRELTGAPLLSEEQEGEPAAVAILVVRDEEGDGDALAVPLTGARSLLALAEGSSDAAGEQREGRIEGAETAARSIPARAGESPAGAPEPPAQPAQPAGAAAPTGAGATAERLEEAGLPDVSGEWLVVNTIERTPHAPFEGLRLGFRLTLRQRGAHVTGQGEKLYEEGRRLAPAARSPIRLEGDLEGNTLTATFQESGARRTIHGVFSWVVDEEGEELGGRFADASARTSGSSRGERLE